MAETSWVVVGGGGCRRRATVVVYLPLRKRTKNHDLIWSKLQVLSFMFTSNCRRYPLAQKLTSYVLNVSKSCTLCPLGQTQLDFIVKSGNFCNFSKYMRVLL
ncbi:hypothetical protein Hanom_Chr09g00847871 [Helianthus anomalus]